MTSSSALLAAGEPFTDLVTVSGGSAGLPESSRSGDAPGT